MLVAGVAAMGAVPRHARSSRSGLMGFGAGRRTAAAACMSTERNRAGSATAAKVMTPSHIKKWTKRQLARIGIRLGGGRGDGERLRSADLSSSASPRPASGTKPAAAPSRTRKGTWPPRKWCTTRIMRRATDIHLEPKEDELGPGSASMASCIRPSRSTGASATAIVNIFKVLSRAWTSPRSGGRRTGRSARSSKTARSTSASRRRGRGSARR